MKSSKSFRDARYAARTALYEAQPVGAREAERALTAPRSPRTGRPMFPQELWRRAAALEWDAFCLARKELESACGDCRWRRVVVLEPLPRDWTW
jgi:hypothetical protein